VTRSGLCLVALAALGTGCSYDLDALRRRDAAAVVDRPRVDAGTAPDVAATDVVTDQGAGPTDAGVVDQDSLRVGACNATGVSAVPLAPPIAPPRAGAQPATLAYAMALNNLQGAPMLGLPTVTTDGGVTLQGCPTRDDVRTPPTRIYRYQVAEGGSVTATTNTQHCTALDTRVYAMWSCGAGDLASPIGCADDLANGRDTARCPTCGSGGGDGGVACTPLMSTLDLTTTPALRRGEVVYFAVTGFDINAATSAHRLWVGENAARIEAFPATPTRPPVNRCACQTNTDSARTVYFPHFVVGENFPPTVSAMGTAMSFLGVRDVAQGMYTGVALQLRINRWNLSSDTTTCPRNMVRAVFDLIVGTTLVTSFSIDANLAPPVTVTVPYTAFAPTLLTRGGAGMVFELRLRQVLPDAACLTLDLDQAQGASAITLYGGS